VIFLICFLLLSVNGIEDLFNEFSEWKLLNKKEYSSDAELNLRFVIWKNNREFVLQDPEHLALNHLSDLSVEEFSRTYLISAVDVPPLDVMPFNSTVETLGLLKALPATLNWNEKNVVTPAVSQGNCGSCAAFAATAGIESAYAIKTGRLVKFSEQSILDCVVAQCVEQNPACTTRRGCCGNHIHDLLQLAKDKSIIEDKSYDPYAFDRYCVSRPMCPRTGSQAGTKVTNYWKVPASEKDLMIAVNEQPISFGIYFDERIVPYLQQYKAGTVFNPPTAGNKKNQGHAMLITGWGSGPAGDFWHVKNSWGPDWGDRGFMKVARFRNNILDIANHAWRITT